MPHTVRNIGTKSSILNGFGRKPWMRQSSVGTKVAEMTKTGMSERKVDAARAPRNPSPSISGMIQSRRMAQGATPFAS